MSGIRWQDHAHSKNITYNSKKTCQRLLQFGWCTDCESKQKAFIERLAQRYPEEYQLPIPDPPHNVKSVRSSLFWYWLFLDDYLINIRMLPIIRRDQDDNIACPMKHAVTMKALMLICLLLLLFSAGSRPFVEFGSHYISLQTKPLQ